VIVGFLLGVTAEGTAGAIFETGGGEGNLATRDALGGEDTSTVGKSARIGVADIGGGLAAKGILAIVGSAGDAGAALGAGLTATGGGDGGGNATAMSCRS